ncbi:MAG: ABC transporter substrate-binding protein [Pseudomonadota bacterium]
MAKKREYLRLRDAFFFLFLLCVVCKASAADVAIVGNSNTPPCNEAIKGFIDRTNARITQYDLDKEDNRQRIIADIKAKRPHLIFALGTDAATFVSGHVKDIPIVFALVSRPEKYGLTGGNITGVSLNISSRTQFEVLKEVLPRARRIGVIHNPEESAYSVKKAAGEAHSLGLQLIQVPVESEKEIPQALRAIKDQIDVLWMTTDQAVMIRHSIEHIIMFTIKNNIPLMAFSPRFVEGGALCALASDYRDIGCQAAGLAGQILSGKRPDELPVVSPRKTKLILNLKTAKLLGLNLSLRHLEKKAEIETYQ